MNDYQLTVILNPNSGEAKLESLLTQIKKLTEIKKVDTWTKSLAYPIKHLSEGYFANIELSSSPADIVRLDKSLKTSDDIVRYLLTRKD